MDVPFTGEEKQIEATAIDFAKANKKAIARRWADKNEYPPEPDPVSIFMAGSPGAGKTEASIELIDSFLSRILRIDPDELRCELPGYKGSNAYLFHGAASILVEKIHDLALKQKQSFLLDGTLSHYGVAKRNIERLLNKERTVQILYVYQLPVLACEFVQAREAHEGRRIESHHFIEQYFEAREVVNRLKVKYGQQIQVDLLLKNTDNSPRHYQANIGVIDNFIPEIYTRGDLEARLSQPSVN
jgi:predicted ABC-type ATPase